VDWKNRWWNTAWFCFFLDETRCWNILFWSYWYYEEAKPSADPGNTQQDSICRAAIIARVTKSTHLVDLINTALVNWQLSGPRLSKVPLTATFYIHCRHIEFFHTLAHICGKTDRMFINFTTYVSLDKEVSIKFWKPSGSVSRLQILNSRSRLWIHSGSALSQVYALLVLLFQCVSPCRWNLLQFVSLHTCQFIVVVTTVQGCCPHGLSSSSRTAQGWNLLALALALASRSSGLEPALGLECFGFKYIGTLLQWFYTVSGKKVPLYFCL